MSNAYPAGGTLLGPAAGAPILPIASLAGSYGRYKGDSRELSRSMYSVPRDERSSKEFSLCIVCPTANIGGVIGKGGAIINQIRQESGAIIKVDSSTTDGDDCLITISAKEFFEDAFSPTIEVAVRLQPRCSERVERDSGILSFTTRLLVPTSRNLPKVASEDDEMVQIAGDPDVAKDALVQITTRLTANFFDREGAVSPLVPALPYLPMPTEGTDSLSYENRESKRHGRGHTYSGGFGSSDLAPSESYGTYGAQVPEFCRYPVFTGQDMSHIFYDLEKQLPKMSGKIGYRLSQVNLMLRLGSGRVQVKSGRVIYRFGWTSGGSRSDRVTSLADKIQVGCLPDTN
ncbi:RNA-binding KH domain-containing protein isoform 1 [Hibiscus syriacus]|uniref:RNA-binding KH domain-containing protein isoform 1 n=1 Tax=Hibiscus syriacus TaxID=106335 RepID=A0A6A2ZUW4_HIBSY|nr:RNA-binding KH domain-containing protein isoform 1 [Hibiscus syriacus]